MAPSLAPSVETKVKLLGHGAAQKVGLNGLLFTVDPAEQLPSGQELRVSLDYSSFASAYGGSYGSRLKLMQMPACALTTPAKATCLTPKGLGSKNSTEDGGDRHCSESSGYERRCRRPAHGVRGGSCCKLCGWRLQRHAFVAVRFVGRRR